jgi:flagellar protein FlbD
VILVTRLNGPEFALNPDLVERAESTPDTVVTLVDGTKYVIAESVDELIRLVRLYRAGVLADAQRLTEVEAFEPVPVPVRDTARAREQGNNVVPLHPRER